jgi:methyl-accepting chemotaxis protein
MVRALKIMRDNVADFIFNRSDSAEQVAASSEALTATSLQAATTLEEIATTIEEIAKGAEDQANDTETTADNVEEMGKLMELDSQYLDELNTAAVQIEKQKEEGFTIIKELIDKTKKNNDASNSVYRIIRSNNESTEKIDNASSMIQIIADQTNLLKTIISVLKEKSQNAVDLMQHSKQILTEQTMSVEATEEKFEGIAEAIDIIKNIIDKLNHSADLMAGNKSKVIELTQNLAAISEENAAGTQEASAVMEE